MVVLRLDAALYFANVGISPSPFSSSHPKANRRIGFLKDKIRIEERKKIDPLAWPANSDLEEGANRLRGLHMNPQLWCSSLKSIVRSGAGVVVLDWSSINDLDYTACTEIEGIAKYLKEKNILFLQALLPPLWRLSR